MPEREIKLGLDPTAPPLELGAPVVALPGVRVAPVRLLELETTYFDTPDLRLVRSGLSLRHRRGEGGPDGIWTLKLPDDGTVKGGLSRAEIEEPGPDPEVPDRLRTLVRAYVRHENLAPAVRLRTSRRVWPVLDPTGAKLAEIDDDTVDVLDGDRAIRRFREVEVEVALGGDDLLARLVGKLQALGAGEADATPKLARALGDRVTQPVVPEIALGPDSDGAEVVRAAVGNALRRLMTHDPIIRLDDDIEGVHRARVATRRLRSDLRTLSPLVERGWADGLRTELKWLAGLLGDVRDTDVLGIRLRGQIDELAPLDRSEALPLLDVLAAHRREAQEGLVAALDSPRYLDLLDALVEAAREPPLTIAARRRAGKLLPGLAALPWRKLVKEVKALSAEPGDDALHQVRIRAKRARYAAELAAPVVGGKAAALAEALTDLQDELGELHDAGVAEGWIRAAVGRGELRHRAGTGLAAGLLVARQRSEAADRRRAWPKVWRRARRRDLTKWLA
jgi:CHAD domain-containing protein